jgi:fluoride exporter
VIVLAVLAGGMLGAPARYLADRLIQARHDTVFPWGTFTVNVAGSAVVGFLLGAQRHLGLPPVAFALVATGFSGGLTTFSTFGYETLRLLEDGALVDAGINVLGSLAAAILVAWLGYRFAIALLDPEMRPPPRSTSSLTNQLRRLVSLCLRWPLAERSRPELAPLVRPRWLGPRDCRRLWAAP